MFLRKLLMASTAMMVLVPVMVHAQSDEGLFSAAMEIGADTGAIQLSNQRWKALWSELALPSLAPGSRQGLPGSRIQGGNGWIGHYLSMRKSYICRYT
jgi:hypothetical protein